MDLRVKAFFIATVGILSLLINQNLLDFRGEEGLRGLVAFEMLYYKSFLQPIFLGDYYFNKPPLFNWLIILSSFLIPWTELTLRIVSIISFSLTLVVIYKLHLKLFKDSYGAVFAVLSFLTFLDILFFYGYLAEIDMTFAFTVSLIFYFSIVGYIEKNNRYILLSGLFTAVAFLTKGLPAFAYFGLTYIALIGFTRNFRFLLNPYIYIAGFIAVIIPAIWLLNTPEPKKYLSTLIFESTVRAKESGNPLKLLEHMLSYSLMIVKFLIPASLFIIWAVVKYGRSLSLDYNAKVLLTVILVNAIPYFLATQSKGRYLIPLFVLVAVMFGYVIQKVPSEKFKKVFVNTVLVIVLIRLFVGIVGIPFYSKFVKSREKIATEIYYITNKSDKIAFDGRCIREKNIALYLGFLLEKPIKKDRIYPDWQYLISCKELPFKVVREYDVGKKYKVRLYERGD